MEAQATPKAISDAKNDVSTAQQKVKDDQTAVGNAQTKQQDAQNNAQTATAAMSKANQIVADQQKVVDGSNFRRLQMPRKH